MAFTDHQVSMWTAEIQARTAGVHAYQPALADGRHPDAVPLLGLPAVPGDGFTGSALVVLGQRQPAAAHHQHAVPVEPEYGDDPAQPTACTAQRPPAEVRVLRGHLRRRLRRRPLPRPLITARNDEIA
ncbi:MAG: hypothetical protein U5R31_01295 [Acidimicrobiia bacterium]|nr:hypothetical protein [Acidimicrobiia bacterium]